MKKFFSLILIAILSFNSALAVEEIKLETEQNFFHYLSDVYYGKVENASPALKLFSEKGLEFENSPINSIKLTFLYGSEFSFIDRERVTGSFVHDFAVAEPMITAKFNDNKTMAMFDINLLRNLDGYSNDFTQRISKAFVSHKITENQTIVIGQGNRVPTTYNGSRGYYSQEMVLRSQLGRTYGNAYSVGIRNNGTYKYLDYDLGVYDSTRYMKDFGHGMDFTGYLMFKPLADFKEKIGNVNIGTGYSVGDYYNSYSVYSFFLGYDKNKFHFKTEYANADGYNGVKCSSDKSNGFYTTMSYDVSPKLTVIGRYDYLDPSKNISRDSSQEFTVGVTYHLYKNLKLMLNYIRREHQTNDDSNMILFATRFII